MLRKIRIALAAVFYTLITLLFLDFTGTLRLYVGWMAKIQFLPALLALNVGIVVLMLLLTLACGRIYCSVICPMGVFQDIIAWFSKQGKGKKNKYSYSPAKNVLRIAVLVVFVAVIAAGFTSIASFIAPYSAYGRIATNVMQPIYIGINNVLAAVAEHYDSYAFYSADVWMRSAFSLAVALITFVVIGVLAWRGGRTYCNTICPVGTVLGFVAKYSYLKPCIDIAQCNSCGLCAKRCKASAINSKEHKIDYSRCVDCMDCLENCHQNAISFGHPFKQIPNPEGFDGNKKEVDSSKRGFVASVALLATAAVKAQEEKLDGGYAEIIDKQAPKRQTPLTPPGSMSARNLQQHCTACQLCIAECPNGVLRPSTNLSNLMQPTMSYENGHCRPECDRCSSVCPTGAIKPISIEEKASTQIGHAVWVEKNCVPLTDGQKCGNCARHCPTGAIQMVKKDENDENSPEIPVIDTERCIGCGACEHLCPARPFSAIYVEGHEVHKTI